MMSIYTVRHDECQARKLLSTSSALLPINFLTAWVDLFYFVNTNWLNSLLKSLLSDLYQQAKAGRYPRLLIM